LFQRREDILTLGVIIAEEIFGKAIPILTLGPKNFSRILKNNGQIIYIDGSRVSNEELTRNRTSHSYNNNDGRSEIKNIQLSELDRAFMDGAYGEAARASMRIILRMASLLEATELMDVSQVHVDGCIYTGPGSLAFAETLRDWGGRVRVPTSLNSISIDQKRWRAQGVDPAFGEAAGKLADTYVDMGAKPTFTCAPYQLETAPKFGDNIAWAESNAVVYANSVLGARTMKYPDFLDIAIALTGRAPKGGPHIDDNRKASIIICLSNVRDKKEIDDAFYPLLGYHVGSLSMGHIPAVIGVQDLNPSRDDLKAFGAAFATVSSAPMFHIVGVTPEASSLGAVVGPDHSVRTVQVELKELIQWWNKLNTASKKQAVGLISLGNPHFSISEIRKLAELCKDRKKQDSITVVVTCGRATYGLASQAGLVGQLEQFGIRFVTDTCWCMITDPIIPLNTKAIMTNSGKYAHYGPGLTGREFYFGSLADCVETACRGGAGAARPGWMTNVEQKA
jgi:predicted aconitase